MQIDHFPNLQRLLHLKYYFFFKFRKHLLKNCATHSCKERHFYLFIFSQIIYGLDRIWHLV